MIDGKDLVQTKCELDNMDRKFKNSYGDEIFLISTIIHKQKLYVTLTINDGNLKLINYHDNIDLFNREKTYGLNDLIHDDGRKKVYLVGTHGLCDDKIPCMALIIIDGKPFNRFRDPIPLLIGKNYRFSKEEVRKIYPNVD